MFATSEDVLNYFMYIKKSKNQISRSKYNGTDQNQKKQKKALQKAGHAGKSAFCQNLEKALKKAGKAFLLCSSKVQKKLIP